MTYEITIRELEPFTEEEQKKADEKNRRDFSMQNYSLDKNYHERRVTHAELSREEFEAVKKAIIGVL